MSYKYLIAGNTINDISPKQFYSDLFRETLENGFANATDWLTIGEEYPIGSKTYNNIDARVVAHIIANETGDKVGDDYRRLQFKDIEHVTDPGFSYYFNNNYWININSETKPTNLGQTCLVKRCNNTLRWIDEKGAIYSEPCIINYLIRENRDYSTTGTAVVLPAGMIEVITQFNDRTNTIYTNQRFLLGNANKWSAYKILGGGINNFINLETIDNMSNGLLRISMNINFTNDSVDDLTRGIADKFINNYRIVISESVITSSVGTKRKLHCDIYLNGKISNTDVEWMSEDESVAVVDSVGEVTFTGEGFTNVYVRIAGDDSVNDKCEIITDNALNSGDYGIVVAPNDNFVLKGSTKTFSIYLYRNGIRLNDKFTFTDITTNIPSNIYTFAVVDDNNFIISNIKKWLDDSVIIRCVSGSNTKDVTIGMKGIW